MAMNGDLMGVEMKTAIDAVSDKADRLACFQALGNAIVNHIKTNGAIVVNSVTLVQTGIGTSGPGTGTIS
jgi:hypothetical protein